MSIENPNHDDHPLNQAFTKSLKEWLDAGASLSSVLQVLEEECWSREERARIGDPLVKGSTDDWRVAAGEFFGLQRAGRIDMKAKLIKAEGIPANNGLVEGEIYEVETEERYPNVYAVMSGTGVSRVGLYYMQNRFEKIEEGQ